MIGNRSYPEESVGPFPSPPQAVTDTNDREIHIEVLESDAAAAVPALVDMYDTFNPADRAQGIPPVGYDAIIEWLDAVLAEGLDVIARHDDRIIGHATLVPESSEAHELAIFVHQEYQGAGIGSTLLRCLLGAAAEHSIELIWLTVERWNTVAIGLYESVGFTACDRGRFEHEMALRLDEPE